MVGNAAEKALLDGLPLFLVDIRGEGGDDPVAFVKEREPNNELKVSTDKDGTIIVETDHNGFAVKYEFTED